MSNIKNDVVTVIATCENGLSYEIVMQGGSESDKKWVIKRLSCFFDYIYDLGGVKIISFKESEVDAS